MDGEKIYESSQFIELASGESDFMREQYNNDHSS